MFNSLRDQVALFNNPARLRVPAFMIIDRIQQAQSAGTRPGEAILATAVALIAMCESSGLKLDDVIFKASRVMADVEGPFTSHLQAVRDYARNELREAVL